jgi:uncharacterized protein (DUF3084 family)
MKDPNEIREFLENEITRFEGMEREAVSKLNEAKHRFWTADKELKRIRGRTKELTRRLEDLIAHREPSGDCSILCSRFGVW